MLQGFPKVSAPKIGRAKKKENKTTRQFFVTFLGWLSDPFKGLSDLQLGDEKGTMNHLVVGFNPFEKNIGQIGSFPQGSG